MIVAANLYNKAGELVATVQIETDRDAAFVDAVLYQGVTYKAETPDRYREISVVQVEDQAMLLDAAKLNATPATPVAAQPAPKGA